jgi:hydroxymethylpyrimidine/phosphomethylpyrimidine kinase
MKVGTSESLPPPVALSIAGSDSGGGAGIQADLKTFQAFGVFGATAITAVTAQNTLGVRGVRAMDPEFVREQIDAVCEDLHPGASKTGMLADAGIIVAVAESITKYALERVVVDPVMVATSGDPLLEPDAVDALIGALLPLAAVVTPNVPEAEVLAGMTISHPDDLEEAARRIVERGAGAALVKGGHLDTEGVTDLFWDGTSVVRWGAPRIMTRHTHGTGCTLSAAVAAGLACEAPLERAVDAAIAYTRDAIESAPGLGGGHGPLNHWTRWPCAPPNRTSPGAIEDSGEPGTG